MLIYCVNIPYLVFIIDIMAPSGVKKWLLRKIKRDYLFPHLLILMASRPPIPAELERALLIESGHRCAIPTCRATAIHIHHIKPYCEVKEHKFANMIVLCPNCHQRVHSGGIDRKSLKIYKANLGVLNNRYNDFERRILKFFIDNQDESIILLPYLTNIFFKFLVDDGILRITRESAGLSLGDCMPVVGTGITCELTDFGVRFISDIKSGEILI